MAKKMQKHEPAGDAQKAPPAPIPTGPGFRVSRHPGPGAGNEPQMYGMAALRSKLGLSNQPGADEVARTAVARIDELEKQLAEAEPGGEKLDVESKSVGRQL